MIRINRKNGLAATTRVKERREENIEAFWSRGEERDDQCINMPYCEGSYCQKSH